MKIGDELVFSKTSDPHPWLFEYLDASGGSDKVFVSKLDGESMKYTLMQWGTKSNEVGYAKNPDEMSLLDSRFHWTITNPFDVMLFKYQDDASDSRITFNFSDSYEFGLFISFLKI